MATQLNDYLDCSRKNDKSAAVQPRDKIDHLVGGSPSVTPLNEKSKNQFSSWNKFFLWNTATSGATRSPTTSSQSNKLWFSWLPRSETKKQTSFLTKRIFPFFSYKSSSEASTPVEPLAQDTSPENSIIKTPPVDSQKKDTDDDEDDWNSVASEPHNMDSGGADDEEDDCHSVASGQHDDLDSPAPLPSSPSLKTIDPFEGLIETEKINFQKEISSGKLISKLGSPKIDTDGVKSLPECRLYQLIDVPTKNAAAIFWDAEALHETAPKRVKTSEIKNLNNTTVEAVFQTSVGVWGMSDDISKVTTTVEPVAHDGYLFTWSLSPGNQDRAYTKASNGSLLLLPHEGKTLVAYKAISTLKSNTFYNMAAVQIEGTMKETVQGIVKAIAQGQEKPQKLQGQVSVLEAACG